MDDDDKPILTEQELFEYLHDELGLTNVARRTIKYAVMRREIVPTRLSNNNYFSRRDGLDWLASRKREVPTRYVGPNVGRIPQ